MESLTILFVHNYYKIRGGEDYCFEEEVKLLKENGHNVIEYIRHNDEVDAMSSIQLLKSLIWSEKSKLEVRSLIKKHDVDVMHVHNFFPLVSPSVYTEAERAGVPVVQTLHNYRLACANSLFLRDGQICERCSGKNFGINAVKYGCYRSSRLQSAMVTGMTSLHRFLGTWSQKVSQFIVPSAFVFEKMIEHGLPPGKLKVRANVVSVPDMELNTGSRSGAVYVGRLSEEKGVVWLVTQWRKYFPEVPLQIIGEGPDFDKLTALSEGSKIQLHGKADREQCLKFLSKAKMLVMPSACYETFGRTVVEAYSVGTPVLVPTGGALSELVSDDYIGEVFKFGDSTGLCRYVNSLLSSNDGERAQKIYQHYRENYSNDVLYGQVIDIYRNLIK